MSTTMKLGQSLQKALISGSVSAFGISILTDKASSRFIYNGTALPVWQVAGGIGAASSVLVAVISKLILPHIPHNKKSQHLESLTLHLATAGALFYAVPYMMNSELRFSEGSKFIVAGAVAEMISSYINDYVIAIEESASDSFIF